MKGLSHPLTKPAQKRSAVNRFFSDSNFVNFPGYTEGIRLSDPDRIELESFLRERFGFQIPNNLDFIRMSQKKLNGWLQKDESPEAKVVNLSVNDFLIDDFLFDEQLERIVVDTVIQNDLKIYCGIVSYDGRGASALTTGGNTLNNLKKLESKGCLTRFLSYQGNKDNPSPLCRYAMDEGVRVYFVDSITITDSERRLLLDRKARGKTENILKFLLMLNGEIHATQIDPAKVFVLFLDDDYTLLDDRAHCILLAAWVLSFANSKDKRLGKLISQCKDVAFIKNGGVRIHMPEFLTRKIINGEKPVLRDYRSLLVETLHLEIEHNTQASEQEIRQLEKMICDLQAFPSNFILTPENLPKIVSAEEIQILRRIMKRYFYAGGRVTKPFTRKHVHESENFLSNWLGSFTYILHGDQGTTLDNWLSLKLGQGYAFESSVIIQFLMDEKFSDQKIADIRNMPHAHQPQEQPQVDGMEDLVNLVTETLRVYYNNWDVNAFIARYQKRTRVTWLPDGSYIREQVNPEKGILFYPPASCLHIN
jgi:hypothetical protein